MEKITQKVTKNGKILKILSENLQNYKYSAFEKALRNKDILLNGKRIKQNENVEVGDEITIFLDKNSQKDLYKIFWEDENFIVFDKMQGIEVCDGEYNLCSEYFSKTDRQLFPIHRIDRNTMGLVMFAKSKDMQNKMIELFKLGCVTKNYYAIVTGEPKDSDILQGYLKKDSELIKVKIFDKKVQGSVFVETKYIMQKNYGEIKLLFVEIKDGKTHQIRAHLSYVNLPILGDEKYGDTKINKKYGEHKQLLQAFEIVFNVPKENELGYLNNIKLKQDINQKLSKINAKNV